MGLIGDWNNRVYRTETKDQCSSPDKCKSVECRPSEEKMSSPLRILALHYLFLSCSVELALFSQCNT